MKIHIATIMTWLTKVLSPESVWTNVYNYLVATKDEPVQDRRTNTEKILSAGFDTKTSFRNVKKGVSFFYIWSISCCAFSAYIAVFSVLSYRLEIANSGSIFTCRSAPLSLLSLGLSQSFYIHFYFYR